MAQMLDYNAVARLFPEIAEIENAPLRASVAEIWCEIASEMAWDHINQVPKDMKNGMNRRLLEHVRGVTQMAVAMAEIAKNLYGKTYDRDMLYAACLLHDADKPVLCEPDTDKPSLLRDGRPTPRKSELGRKIQHGVYTAHKIMNKGMSLELAHLVITHTHHSNVRATTWESATLFYADFADTDVGLSNEGLKLYSERWTAGH